MKLRRGVGEKREFTNAVRENSSKREMSTTKRGGLRGDA